jgi:hypothetical protein
VLASGVLGLNSSCPGAPKSMTIFFVKLILISTGILAISSEIEAVLS